MTLRSLRLYLGYSLREVAAEAGVALMTLQRIETGQHVARPETLRKVELALRRLKRRPPKQRKCRGKVPTSAWPRTSGNLTARQLKGLVDEAQKHTNAWQDAIRKRLADGPSTPSELARRTGIDKREVQACLCVLRHKHVAEPCRYHGHDGRETPHWRLVGWVDEPERQYPPDVRDARGIGR